MKINKKSHRKENKYDQNWHLGFRSKTKIQRQR